MAYSWYNEAYKQSMNAPKNTSRISPNSVSLAGEFAALSRLTLWGYDANMTLGRTKSVDILISNPSTNQLRSSVAERYNHFTQAVLIYCGCSNPVGATR